jgi:hypothetical protein
MPSASFVPRLSLQANLKLNQDRSRPPDQLDYRPHERSPSTGQIAWTIVRGLFVRIDIASQCVSDVLLNTHPTSSSMMLRLALHHNWSHGLRNNGREWVSCVSAVALPWRGLPVTSSGCSTSTRSIIAANFLPICGQWARRSPICGRPDRSQAPPCRRRPGAVRRIPDPGGRCPIRR